MARIEVTIPLTLSGSLTFEVDDAAQVTAETIGKRVADAQRMVDRAGNDSMTGVYFVIDDHGEAVFEVLAP